MSNELERYQPREVEAPAVDSWTDVFRPIVALAEHVAGTDFVPKGLRGSPPATAAAMLFGRELGMGPMKSLQNIHVIDGVPTLKPQEMRAMVYAAGHSLKWGERSKNKCVIAGRRRGETDWTTVEWTMQDARDMNLTGKPNWRRMPRQMLVARATGELCRLVFPDVIGGSTYTPEEISDGASVELPDQGAPEPAGEPAPRKAKRKTPVKPEPKPEPVGETLAREADEAEAVAEEEDEGRRPPLPGEITDAELIEEDAPTLISPAQLRKLQAFFTSHDITDRSHKLEIARAITGRTDLHSSTDLTAREASQLIDTLARLAHQSGGEFPRALDLVIGELGARAITNEPGDEPDATTDEPTDEPTDKSGDEPDDKPDKEAAP